MTDWSLPTTASTYANYTTELINRDASLAKQFDSALVTDTNVLTDTIRWNSSSKIWERWSGTAWGALAATYGINVSQLLGSTWAAPGTIGSTTPSTGAFTTLSTTGNVTLGDATTDTLNVGNGDLIKDASGNVGVGIATPDNKLHVHKGSAGAVAALATAPIVVENNTTSYIQTLSPDASVSGLVMGSPGDSFGALVNWTYTGALMTIGTQSPNGIVAFVSGSNDEQMRIHASGGISINNTTDPGAGNLSVTGTGSFTGILTAPTAAAGTDTTQVATTAFVQAASKITLATQQATTSGTSIDFTSIPATAKRITIMLNEVSTSGTSYPIIQIGDSGGPEATGYVSQASNSAYTTTSATGFIFSAYHASGSHKYTGTIRLTLMDAATFTWIATGNVMNDLSSGAVVAGAKSLSAALDRVRITTTNGTDTFDAGAINITYE